MQREGEITGKRDARGRSKEIKLRASMEYGDTSFDLYHVPRLTGASSVDFPGG